MMTKRILPPVRILAASAALYGALCSAPSLAWAQNLKDPATFAADEMTHDKEQGVITARGHVEVNTEERTLIADSISYNQRTDTIRASGNVALHQSNGDILFAEVMEVTGDLKNGMIADIRAILADRSRFAAKQATLKNDETLTLDRGVYTRCEPCEDDPTRPPLWQLKAIKVVHDRKNKIVEYKDAWLEVAGIPVVYTPYLSYPDPSVKRKSGFLTPRFGGSSDLGFVVRTPYFHVIDEHSDLTVTPIVTSSEYGALAGQYRQKFTKGEIDAELSGAYNASNEAFGHIRSEARFDLNRTWRVAADIDRSTSDTYLRRYGFGNDRSLTSQVKLEGFRGNNYTSVSALSFQGLKSTDDSRTTPVVLPYAQFTHQSDPDKYGAYNALDINAVAMTRELGADSTRISVRPSWNISHTAPKGDVYKLSATMGLDFFHVQDLDAPAARGDVIGGKYNGAALRAYPELAFDWRWPFARRHGTVTEVLEPIGQVVLSPYGGNSYKMPNEDSQNFDFNDTNLFSANRFTGYDRVESGPRANYGVKWSLTGDGGGSTSLLFGQSYRLANDDAFSVGSGLEDNRSDYVARVKVSPGDHLNLLYRTRLDKDTLDFRRNELGLSGAYSIFSYSTDFVFFDRQEGSEYQGRKEISYTFGSELTKDWRTRFSGVRDLSQNGGQRSMQLNLVYEDECLTFDTALSRTFYLDREVRPTDAIMFRIVFKTLGEVTTDVVTSN